VDVVRLSTGGEFVVVIVLPSWHALILRQIAMLQPSEVYH